MSWFRWATIAAIFLIVLLTPFFLFENDINDFVERLTRSGLRIEAIAFAVVCLLALDVFLPVPSSVVSTAAGATLGFFPGLVASTTGMTLACVLAYTCGRTWGLPLLRRFTGDRDLEIVSQRFRRSAGWTLAAMRPVPVLAEVSVLFAGVSRLSLPVYLMITTLANIGISAVYCAAGARALAGGSLLLAFAASLVLPGLAIVISRLGRRSRIH
jgi:uncharacterized membrane protein YdjX (TVP38/TMEM64 family)